MNEAQDTLVTRLGLPENFSLYEAFAHFFGATTVDNDNDVEDTLEMLLSGEPCYCLILNRSVCFFTIKGTFCTTLFEVYESDFTDEAIHNAVLYKRCLFYLCRQGFRVDAVFSDDSLKWVVSRSYSLSEMLLGYSVEDAFWLGSKSLVEKEHIRAGDLVSHLRIDNELHAIYPRSKDISSCTSSCIGTSGCSYGLILDCEGKVGLDGRLDHGFREIGGLVWCRKGKILVSVEQFSCDEVLFPDVMKTAIETLRSFKSKGSIDVLVFGSSDEQLFLASCKNMGVSKRVYKAMKFHNVSSFVYGETLRTKGSLAEIARDLGVTVVCPRHKAVNDARTLLNVLAKILYKKGSFVI